MFINCLKEPLPSIQFGTEEYKNVILIDEFKLGYQNFAEWKSDEVRLAKRKVPGGNEEVEF